MEFKKQKEAAKKSAEHWEKDILIPIIEIYQKRKKMSIKDIRSKIYDISNFTMSEHCSLCELNLKQYSLNCDNCIIVKTTFACDDGGFWWIIRSAFDSITSPYYDGNEKDLLMLIFIVQNFVNYLESLSLENYNLWIDHKKCDG